MNYEIGDTVEVRVNSAFKGEVGRVVALSRFGPFLRIRFADGQETTLAEFEVRHSQQKLDL
jgi:hypothetical protein